MTKQLLADLEHIIESNRKTFYHIGKALKRIRDEQLYRQLLFDSFEAYVRLRWDMARSHAYRLIEASNVIDNLSPIGDKILPQNESQARALSRLEPKEQRAAWIQFIQSKTPLSASNIRKFIKNRGKKVVPGIEANPENLTEIISTSYKAAVMAMLEQIRSAQNDHWQTTSKPAALFWLRVMEAKILSTLHHNNPT